VFRGPMGMRRGPGLLGAMARTAVVAGTATAVSNKVSQAQHMRYAQSDAEPQMVEMQQAPAPPSPPPAAAPAEDDRIAQLERLGKLREQGLLTDEELAAEKARILG
jgi:hypothetical protein